MYILRKIVEYRQLRVRRYLERESLGPGAERRLAELERWLERRPQRSRDADDARRWARFHVEMRAHVEHAGGVTPVLLQDISGGGVLLAAAPPLARGEMGVLVIDDHEEGCSYRVPLQVLWSDDAGGGRDRVGHSGCAFVGMPALAWRSARAAA